MLREDIGIKPIKKVYSLKVTPKYIICNKDLELIGDNYNTKTCLSFTYIYGTSFFKFNSDHDMYLKGLKLYKIFII